MSRVGIFGGTFNPPHSAHLRLLRFMREQYALDTLYVVPCALPPHKELAGAVPAEERLRMAELAFGELAEVLDLEIRRGGRSYTVDTLRELSEPGRELILFVGGDMLLTFRQWRDYREILKLAKVYVFPREGEEAALDAEIVKLRAETGGDIERAELSALPLSSTELRGRLQKGEPVGTLVPEPVLGQPARYQLGQGPQLFPAAPG